MATIVLAAAVGLLGWWLYRSAHAAWWCLAAGSALFAVLYGMGRLRIPWPELGLGRWGVFFFNPYLFLTLAYLLILGGAFALLARGIRRLAARRPPG
jgi:hypothetical protein